MKFLLRGTPYSFDDEGVSCCARLRVQRRACNHNAPASTALLAARAAKGGALAFTARHPASCCSSRIARAGKPAIRP